ncbi:MAG: phosphoribosylanthranilate isomerase [Bacteroidales bacterium]|nr:phosphoribosylanthranilate isomerase [Bacteroidales bacterium]
MKIKVCGMRDADNIRAVEALGIDIMGFIFWPGSGRYVSSQPAYLPENCLRAGVFVDADPRDILVAAKAYRLDCIQFHGSETPEYIAYLRKLTARLKPDMRFIKSIPVTTADDLGQTLQYENVCDLFLFDTKGKLPGGNGSQFDWGVLQNYGGQLPYLLSGGIGPGDAERIRAFEAPGCIGIDLNSRFETAPGMKDAEALKTFIDKIRQ